MEPLTNCLVITIISMTHQNMIYSEAAKEKHCAKILHMSSPVFPGFLVPVLKTYLYQVIQIVNNLFRCFSCKLKLQKVLSPNSQTAFKVRDFFIAFLATYFPLPKRKE